MMADAVANFLNAPRLVHDNGSINLIGAALEKSINLRPRACSSPIQYVDVGQNNHPSFWLKR